MGRVLILIAIFLGLLPISCNTHGSCSGEDFRDIKDFRIKSFELHTTNLSQRAVDTTLFYPHDSVVKSLTVKEKIHIAFKKLEDISFINSVVACSPEEPKSKETIRDITFIAKSTFQISSQLVSIGDTITDNFKVHNGYSGNRSSTKTYIDEKRHLYLHDRINFGFVHKPVKLTTIKFDLVIKLSDNCASL
jgi:hypothetical protein